MVLPKKNLFLNLINFSLIVMFLSNFNWKFYFSIKSIKSKIIFKNSNMDFLPNLIKQGKFIDTVSGLTIFINEKTDNNSFKNIYIQEGNYLI